MRQISVIMADCVLLRQDVINENPDIYGIQLFQTRYYFAGYMQGVKCAVRGRIGIVCGIDDNGSFHLRRHSCGLDISLHVEHGCELRILLKDSGFIRLIRDECINGSVFGQLRKRRIVRDIIHSC